LSVLINGITMPWNTDDNEIIQAALRKCGLPPSTPAVIYRTAVDARKQNDIKKAASVLVTLQTPEAERKTAENYSFCVLHEEFELPPLKKPDGRRVVVAGFGPAGIFAALSLAKNGYKPLVLERGGRVEDRVRSVERFWKSGVLDTESNVQFGEGGAGTFSDGKLTTRVNDPHVRFILKTFAEFGAPASILTQAKPHIGTDLLRGIIKNIREHIITLGGEVRFNSCLTGIETRNGKVRAVSVGSGNERYSEPCDALILAVGHSARDTFEKLLESGAGLSAKPFSVGVRIEHRQEAVDTALYGEKHDRYKNLPRGEYQLSKRFIQYGNRAAYTFCMCPGGLVVPSQSEAGTIVTNGMSYHARDGENANSAVCVSVSPADFGDKPLDGVEFARQIEQRAYNIAGITSNPDAQPPTTYAEGDSAAVRGGQAPACTVKGFLEGKPTLSGATVNPTYTLGVKEADFTAIFPDFVTETLRAGLGDFARKMRAFGDGGAVLTAPETRTSSPVRINRNEQLCSVNIKGLYPCGEGAGYAGGIVSAAADGLKCAEAAANFI
jgi:uncharacterized FAD-dependent dehydrogenase